MSAMRETVVAYFDYLCPYAWRGAEVAEWVAEPLGLRFEWRHFSLIQWNRVAAGIAGQVWNERIDPLDATGGLGLRAFLGSCAARLQGPEAFDRYRIALMRARHRDGAPFDEATLLRVAEEVGLQLPRFERDLADPELRTCLAQEHHRAAELDVFGTPTFAFVDGGLAYFRVKELPADQAEAVRLFRAYRELLHDFPYLETVRRPRPLHN